MSLTWRHFEADALAPVAAGLHALEAGIRYPLDADHFTIDHGPDYAAFYRGLGEAHYMVAQSQGKVVGVIAGALRTVNLGARPIPAVYLGDLKVARSHRGTGLARKLVVACVGLMRQRRFRQWRLVYFAAMQGQGGDVTRSLRGLHPGRIVRPLGTLQLYFESPDRLTSLHDSPPPPTGPGLDLSPGHHQDVVSTAGRKDLRLSSGEPWPLYHLVRSPSAWGDLAAYLRRSASQIPDGGVACFGLDTRLRAHVDWLHRNGVVPGARCVVYGFAWPGRLRGARWLHLATAEV